MSKIISRVSVLLLSLLVALVSPVFSYAADSNVGNEVVNAANSTLTRTGAGTAANPYLLQLNLGNANTWTAAQTFNGTVTLLNNLDTTSITNSGNITNNGNLTNGGNVAINGGSVTTSSSSASLFNTNATTLSVGGAATSLSVGAGTGTTTLNNNLTVNLVDNSTNATDVQQGTNNYLNVSTADGAETVSFGNSLTNPLYFFLGNGSATFSGNVNVSSDIAVNGGDVTTTALTGNLFNTVSTTVNIGGSATTLSLGASSGSATIRNATVSLPNATSFNASSATAAIDTLNIGGGYGTTGTTISSSGNIATNGNVTVDGSETITGSLNAATATFSPGATNDVTINTDADSTFMLTGLSTNTGTQLCLDGSDNVIKCTSSGGGTDLQTAYDSGNTIATTDARDIALTLSDTIIDSNFSVTTASGATGHAIFARADGAGSNDPAQLVLLNNLESDRTQPTGLKIQSATGGMSTALDVSDADIVTALSTGSNDLSGTNWSLTGSTGNFTTSGDIAVQGGDVVTTASTGNVFNTLVTTLNIGGAATSVSVGSSSGTTTVNNALTIFGSLTAGSATFSPGSTSDVTLNTDADSNIIVNGLQTASGDALCLDASNVLVKCDGAALNASTINEESSLSQTVERQQQEINALKQELEALKAQLQ